MITTTYVKSKKEYKVSFELPTDQVGEGRDVRVLGSFNDWSWDNGLQLKKGKKAYTGNTQLSSGNYQFRYLVDGHHWANDDSAAGYTDSGYGTTNCCINLDEVAEEPKKKAAPKKAAAKKAPAKKAAKKEDAQIEAASSAPASKPVTPKADKPTAKKAPAKKAAPKKATAKKAAPAKKSTGGKKGDDLKKIEGVGPKIAGLLNDAGITTFAELAAATPTKLADVLQEAGARFRLAKPDTWQEQAKLAADGKTDELKQLQDKLKGGRR